MFDRNDRKYISRGVDTEVPLITQIVIWSMIDNIITAKDYLQVFDLTKAFINGEWVQNITHTQEEPAFRQEATISIAEEDIIDGIRIFVIDGTGSATMMLNREYW